MTMSEPSGDAMNTSFLGIACLLVLESLLILEEVPLPNWFLPYQTSYDIVSLSHRLFPAFMNGSRSIFGAFYEDPSIKRVEALQDITTNNKQILGKVQGVLQSCIDKFTIRVIPKKNITGSSREGADVEFMQTDLVAHALERIASRIRTNDDMLADVAAVEAKAELIKDPVKLKAAGNSHSTDNFFDMITNIIVYLLSRVAFGKFMKTD